MGPISGKKAVWMGYSSEKNADFSQGLAIASAHSNLAIIWQVQGVRPKV
jgi:hypothetical protein